MKKNKKHPTKCLIAISVLMVAIVIAVAGCGSSSKSSSTPSSSSSSSSAAASSSSGTTTSAAASGSSSTKGAPLVIGSICSCSGPLSSTTATDPDTLNAWAMWTNAHGGINGHPVKVINLDDALTASTSIKDAKQLVEQDHVLAIVGETSNLDILWASYVQSKGVPVIGAALFESPYETNPDFYPTGPQNATSVYGDVAQAKALGGHKLALMYCAESPSCATYVPQYKAIGKLLGISVVSVQKISATAPSYTANCLAAKAAGADVLAILQAGTVVQRVADECGEQGYRPTEVNLSFTPAVAWQTDPNLQGLVTITPNQSLWASSSATQAYNQALAKYAPTVKQSATYNPSNASVWAAAEVFKLAAQRAMLTPSSTPADVIKGLDTFKNETLGGLTAPLTYTKGATKPGLVTCYFVSTIKNQKWIAPLGAKAACVPKSQVAQIEALNG